MLEHESHGTWCKICGITAAADADAAQSAGADALGFNCYPGSPRFIDAAQIAEIASAVSTTSVALFVNAKLDEVERVLSVADIDLLQFHGDEEESFCAGFGLPYMKVLRMAEEVDIRAFAERYHSAWALLLDAYHPRLVGGTGEKFDWRRWHDVDGRRLVLAGGLTPDDVAGAIAQIRPFGVDVCGGVEGPVKGCKDHQKVAQFVRACKENLEQ
jgi:phosphoribosylanthranilate isomerase